MFSAHKSAPQSWGALFQGPGVSLHNKYFLIDPEPKDLIQIHGKLALFFLFFYPLLFSRVFFDSREMGRLGPTELV